MHQATDQARAASLHNVGPHPSSTPRPKLLHACHCNAPSGPVFKPMQAPSQASCTVVTVPIQADKSRKAPAESSKQCINATRRHASQACNHWPGRSQPQHGSRQGRPARTRFLVSTSKCQCDHFHLPCHHDKKSHLRQAVSPAITSPRQSNDLRDNAWTQSTLDIARQHAMLYHTVRYTPQNKQSVATMYFNVCTSQHNRAHRHKWRLSSATHYCHCHLSTSEYRILTSRGQGVNALNAQLWVKPGASPQHVGHNT